MKSAKNDIKHTQIIRIDNEIYEKLRIIAFKDRISINKLVNQAIIQYLIQTQKNKIYAS